MRTIVIVLFAMLVTPSAHSSDWKLVATSDASIVSIDALSLARIGEYRKFWVMTDWDNDVQSSDHPPKYYRSSKVLWYASCSRRTLFYMQTSLYSGILGSGNAVFSKKYDFQPSREEEVVPDTVGEKLLNFACSKQLHTPQKKQRKPTT